MIITKISIPDSVITNGLKTISMNKLQQVVLLTGKNGSGKSRLLNQIANMFGQKPIKSELIQLKSSIESYETATKTQYESIEHLEQAISTVIQPEQIARFRQQIDQCRLNIQSFDLHLSQWYQRLRWNYIETDAEAEKYIAIPFVPKNLNIRDCSNDGSNNLQSIADTASNIGVNNLHESSFAKIQVIQNRWFSVTHPMSTISAEEKKEAIEEYTRLKEIIRIFLNTEVDRNINDQATLFGFPLGQANLSDGQKIILQYCIALHSQGISLKEHILLLDEPDNHLHPSIIIEMIERIISYNPDGQIWIATHSIPLLSYFDPQCIWYLEQGVVSRGLKITEKVLSSLLGNESQIEKLKDFINLPAIQAISRFAFESLFPPKAVVTDCSDPQTIQVHTEIEQQIRPAGKIKILDFGAGKCRLLSGYDGDIKQFKEQIDYYAFDATLSDKQECINAIARIYEEDSDKRHYSQIKDLDTHHDDGTFDIVLMCNVLHEIDPKDWLKIFGNDGSITRLLSKNGIFLIVEDHQIPHGEKAFQNGFIVLDTPELKKLFQISSADKNFKFSDARNDGRLKAHTIPQVHLASVTSETRKEALRELVKNSKEQIRLVRGLEQSYKNGKICGFWLHQLANAELSLSEF